MNNSTMNTVEKKETTTGGKLYDLSMVEAISGGDKTFTKKMLQLFLDTVPATLTDIKNTCDAGEWLALSKHAHKLKSTIDSMNIQSLKQDIRAVEQGGKNGGDPAELKSLTARVLSVMNEVIGQVKKEL